jgi:aspartyl-tRNA(Asn)/glutamyl-tRNA(Gln) amidotransferase subunit B
MKNVMRAIEFEAKRQIDLIEDGGLIEQQTRSFNAGDGSTFMLRSKENANDYRYFPEPDLPPFIVNEAKVQEIKNQMPKLSKALFKEFTEEFGLSVYDANIISDDKYIAAYYKAIIAETKNYKAAANWLIGPIKSYLNEQAVEIKDFPIAPQVVASIIALIEEGKLNFATATNPLFPALLANPTADVLSLAESLNIIQNSDSGAIAKIIDEVLAENEAKVAEFRAGKVGLMGMFMGQVMRKSGGKADPKIATALLTEKLN